jgi:hypothetical protein
VCTQQYNEVLVQYKSVSAGFYGATAVCRNEKVVQPRCAMFACEHTQTALLSCAKTASSGATRAQDIVGLVGLSCATAQVLVQCCSTKLARQRNNAEHCYSTSEYVSSSSTLTKPAAPSMTSCLPVGADIILAKVSTERRAALLSLLPAGVCVSPTALKVALPKMRARSLARCGVKFCYELRTYAYKAILCQYYRGAFFANAYTACATKDNLV